MTVLGSAAPPAGGIDRPLPGNDVRLGATRWPGEGPPVVLLHGLASQRRFWNLVVPHLAGLPVLALDQRGHGDSDRPADGYTLTDVAADLGVAMDALGWSRAVVVGHSWGGAVAATYAAEHAERALALVALDGGFAAPLSPDVDRDYVRRRLEPPRIAMPPEDLVAMMRSYAPAGRWDDEIAAAVLPIFAVGEDGLARARLPFDTHMRIVDSLLDFDGVSTIAGVGCPAWIVACEPPDADPHWHQQKTAAFEALSERAPRARLMRWGGAVHDVPLQWPALVAGLIRSAVAEVATDARATS